MKPHKYLTLAKREIETWESQEPGMLSKFGEALCWPAEAASTLLIPENVQEMISEGIQASLESLASATAWTIDGENIREKVRAHFNATGARPGTAWAELKAADTHARLCSRRHVQYALGEGGVTGTAGFAGLGVDIPALFAILLRQIQQVATCYGYELTSEGEEEYALQVLRVGFAANAKTTIEFILAMKEVEQILLRITWKQMTAELAAKQLGKRSLLAGIRKFAQTLGFQLTKRKALQLLPVVGSSSALP